MDTPEDVAAAVMRHGLTEVWEGLTPGRRRGMLYQVGTAMTEATRTTRIAKLVAGLEGYSARPNSSRM